MSKQCYPKIKLPPSQSIGLSVTGPSGNGKSACVLLAGLTSAWDGQVLFMEKQTAFVCGEGGRP